MPHTRTGNKMSPFLSTFTGLRRRRRVDSTNEYRLDNKGRGKLLLLLLLLLHTHLATAYWPM